MSKKGKYKFWSRFKDSDQAIQLIMQRTCRTYENKYYNVWMSKFKWNGLDEDLKEQQQNYIMRKLWSDGKVAIRNIANTDMIALCPFAEEKYNIYDFPEEINLINVRNVSEKIIPTGIQTVNKDVAIIYALPSQEPIVSIVRYYVERIAQAEVLINNNLKLQNMPFVIGCTEENRARLNDIITKILNNEIVVFAGVEDVNKLQALVTNTPYLVDKLKQHQVALENELLTVLGIDNSGVAQKKAQMLVDEVNSNNDIINDYGRAIEDEIKAWIDRANKVLGRNISIEPKSKPVDTTSDYEDVSITKTKEESSNEI